MYVYNSMLQSAVRTPPSAAGWLTVAAAEFVAEFAARAAAQTWQPAAFAPAPTVPLMLLAAFSTPPPSLHCSRTHPRTRCCAAKSTV